MTTGAGEGRHETGTATKRVHIALAIIGSVLLASVIVSLLLPRCPEGIGAGADSEEA